MNDKQLDKMLNRYCDESKSIVIPAEIRKRLPAKVLHQIKLSQSDQNFWAEVTMKLGFSLPTLIALFLILWALFPNTFLKKEEKGPVAQHSEAVQLKETSAVDYTQAYLSTLSDEEFVSLLMNMNEEGLLPNVESKLFGLDLEVMDFVEMAG